MSKHNNNRKPNVLQVVPSLDCGGVERGTLDISKALSNSGGKSFILTQGGNLEKNIDGDKNTSILIGDVGTKNPIKIYNNISLINNIIKENDIDIIHARSRAPAWSAYYACRKSDKPFVTTFHGVYGLKSRFKKYYNSVMTKGDIVIAVSKFIQNHMIDNYGIDQNKVRVVYRGVDLEYFKPSNKSNELKDKYCEKYHVPKSTPIIVLPSRMTQWKGQEYLVEALDKIKDLNFYCIMVGDLSKHPNYVKRINQLILERKLQSKVQIFGSERNIVNLYNMADIIVSSSIEPEAFGRTIVEAQAMEKIVVATNIGGAVETITDQVNGFHVIPRNSDDMAEKLRYALEILGSKKADDITKSARKNVADNFSLDKMQKDTLDIYSSLI